MNIIADNKINTGTLTATNSNSNFPVNNLYSRFLRLPYKSTSTTPVTITMIFDMDYDIDCGVIGYHNLTSMKIILYDSLDIVLHDSGVIPMWPGYDGVYYTDSTIENVRKVEVLLLSTDSLFYEVGNIFITKKINLPCIKTPSFDPGLGGSYDKSITGQITGTYSTKIRSFGVGLTDISHDKKNELEDMALRHGNFIPFWIDLYEENHEKYQPVFVNLENLGEFEKKTGDFIYDTSLEFQECK